MRVMLYPSRMKSRYSGQRSWTQAPKVRKVCTAPERNTRPKVWGATSLCLGLLIGLIVPTLSLAEEMADTAAAPSPVESAARATASAFAECSGAYSAAAATTESIPNYKNITESSLEQADNAVVAGAWSLYSNKIYPEWAASVSYMESQADKQKQEWIASINAAPNTAEIKQISKRLGQQIIGCARKYSAMQDTLVSEARRNVTR